MRRVPIPDWNRRRIDLPDGDFLDIDILDEGSNKGVLLLHGLEGTTSRTYMRAMARALSGSGASVVGVNFRGCSGEPNRLARSYHSGATEDLRAVLDAIAGQFEHVQAVGFSLGGNMLLKYLGEEGSASRIQRAVAISVPCDLAGSADELAKRQNRLYMWNFMRSLREKMRQKAAAHPGEVDTCGLDSMTTFHEFDDQFTAPLHGFRDAHHYWASCSSMHFLADIRVPTLLLNAKDDPFLSEGCFPDEACSASSFVYLETPERGGHVGFLDGDQTYAERRAVAFLQDSAVE